MTQTALTTSTTSPIHQPNRRFHQIRDVSAGILFLIHLIQHLINYGLFEWIKTEQNMWLIQMTETPTPWIDYTLIVLDISSLIATLCFISFGFLTLFSQEISPPTHLTVKDLTYYLAWNQIVYLIFYYLLSVIGSMVGDPPDLGILMQYMIDLSYLVTAIALFWGRFSVLGFQIRIPYPWLWILLPLFTLSAYLFIALIVDGIITDAVMQIFSLELMSDRTDSIEQDIQSSFDSGWIYLFLQFLAIGVIGPINEEILYRGLYQQLFTKHWGAILGILVSSFIFALDHIDIPFFIPLFISGVILALFRHLYQSLWAPILLHMLLNSTYFLFSILPF